MQEAISSQSGKYATAAQSSLTHALELQVDGICLMVGIQGHTAKCMMHEQTQNEKLGQSCAWITYLISTCALAVTGIVQGARGIYLLQASEGKSEGEMRFRQGDTSRTGGIHQHRPDEEVRG